MKALAVVEAPAHVCCRYRVRAFEPALARAGWSVRIMGLEKGLVSRALQFARLARFDAVLLQRKLLAGWQLRALRRSTDLLIYDFDDAVLYRDSYDPRGPRDPRRAARFAATVRAADAVIAGNDFLADCALRAGASPERVRVIPTCVDTTRYDPRTRAARPVGLDLVWIGSSSTLQGLERERPLWERLAKEVPGLRVRLICDREAELGGMPVVRVPWREATETADVAAGDVGISCVPDDLWSRGKCGLKVLQYQAAGLPVIANPVGVHREMVAAGISGWLPESDAEWIDAARSLATDPEMRLRMGRAGRASVEAGFSVGAWQDTFVATLTGASVVPSPRGSTKAGRTDPPFAGPMSKNPRREGRSEALGILAGGTLEGNG